MISVVATAILGNRKVRRLQAQLVLYVLSLVVRGCGTSGYNELIRIPALLTSPSASIGRAMGHWIMAASSGDQPSGADFGEIGGGRPREAGLGSRSTSRRRCDPRGTGGGQNGAGHGSRKKSKVRSVCGVSSHVFGFSNFWRQVVNIV